MDSSPAKDKWALREPDLLAELTDRADLAALAGPLAHEVNNFLNVVLLQVAVMEPAASPALREELAGIRRQGKNLGDLVRRWQDYRTRHPPRICRVDLNEAVRQATEALGSLDHDAALRLDLAAEPPVVMACPDDIRRVVRFLVGNAAAALPGPGGVVTVRTRRDGVVARLSVEDTGPACTPQQLAHFFDPLAG